MADFDVIIVGAGVAGGLVADQLASAGKKVMVLEAGPTSPGRGQMMKTYFASAIKTPESPYDQEKFAPRPDVLNIGDYYVQKGVVPFSSTYERRVGGTTWHWLGTSLRLVPNDFKLQTKYGKGANWPVAYDDLEKWYLKAEEELGVAGDSNETLGAPRSAGYPARAIEQSYLDKKIAQSVNGVQFDGLPLEVRVTPAARDPDTCIGSTSCIPLCPIGAKYEAIIHLNRAKNKGAIIQDKSVASKIIVGTDGKISGVEYKTWDNQTKTLTANHYVIAANGIETPKLLLMSEQTTAPKGVANSSGQVGRNLMDHPIQLSWALSKKPLYPFRGPLSTSGIESLRDGDFRKDRGAFRVEIGNDGWAWPTGAPGSTAAAFADKKIFGAKLRAAYKDHVNRQVRLASLVEQLPDPANRITPSDKKDDLGIPRPEITFNVGQYERDGLAAAKKAHQLIFDKLEVTEAHHHDEPQGAGHIMGTTRMGASAADAVVDANGKSFDHENLFIVGSSVFPTVGSANPTLTLAALALKTAEFMKTL